MLFPGGSATCKKLSPKFCPTLVLTWAGRVREHHPAARKTWECGPGRVSSLILTSKGPSSLGWGTLRHKSVPQLQGARTGSQPRTRSQHQPLPVGLGPTPMACPSLTHGPTHSSSGSPTGPTDWGKRQGLHGPHRGTEGWCPPSSTVWHPCSQLRIQAHPQVTRLSPCDSQSSGLDTWTDNPSAGTPRPWGPQLGPRGVAPHYVFPWASPTSEPCSPPPHWAHGAPTQLSSTAVLSPSGPAQGPALRVAQDLRALPNGPGPLERPGAGRELLPRLQISSRRAPGQHEPRTVSDTTSCPARAGFLQGEVLYSSIIQVGKPRHRARTLLARSLSWTAARGGHQPVPKLRTGPLAVPRPQELPSQGRNTWLEPDPCLPHSWAPGYRPKLSRT